MALCFRRGQVGSQMGQVARLLGMVEQQAMSPLRAIVQEVVGGVWKGKGADAFVNDVTSISIPGVGEVGQQLKTFTEKVRFAEEVIDAADEYASRLIKDRVHSRFRFY